MLTTFLEYETADDFNLSNDWLRLSVCEAKFLHSNVQT